MTIGPVTELAAHQQAEAVALKSATAAHTAAEGAQQFHRDQRREHGRPAEERDRVPEEVPDEEPTDAEKAALHALTGQFAQSAQAGFGAQRGYLTYGHATDSPENVAGPHVAAPTLTREHATAQGPLPEMIATHGVSRTRLAYGPSSHQSPGAGGRLSTTSNGALASSITPGRATVQRLDYRQGVAPTLVQQSPARPDFGPARLSAVPPVAPSSGAAYLNTPGS